MNLKEQTRKRVVSWLSVAGLVVMLAADLACYPPLDPELISPDSSTIEIPMDSPVPGTGTPDAGITVDPGLDAEPLATSDLKPQPDAGPPDSVALPVDAGLPDLTLSADTGVIPPDSSPQDQAASLPDGAPQDQAAPLPDDAGSDHQVPAPGPSTKVVINEVYPGSGADWFELLNLGSQPVDLSGHAIRDQSNVAATFPPGTTLLPGQHKYFIVAGAPGWPGFKFSKNGDHLQLLDASAKLVDSVSWGATPDTQSWARIPDGSGTFQLSSTSMGSPNQPQGTP